MIEQIAGSKWIEGLYPDTPAVLAAKRTLKIRLKAVDQMVRLVLDPPDDSIEYVHQLRVASRRAGAATRLFKGYLSRKEARRAAKALTEVRRAASIARNVDVHQEMLNAEKKKIPLEAKDAIPVVCERLAEERSAAQKKIRRAGARYGKAKVRRRLVSALKLPSEPGHGGCSIASHAEASPFALGGLAEVSLPPLIEVFQGCTQADLTDGAALHALRIATKKLRYCLEIISSCFSHEPSSLAYRELVKMQSRLGRINDCLEFGNWLFTLAREQKKPDAHAQGNGKVADAPSAVAVLAEHFHRQYARHARRFLGWFDEQRRQKIIEALQDLQAHRYGHYASPPARDLQTSRSSSSTSPTGNPLHRRVAAIDVGTNSIRMAVAETDPAIGFRIIEDIKETTRLGTGVYRSGKLKVGAVKRSLSALEHMRSVAERYQVDSLRAVGTSAVREAANGADFAKLVRRRVGIPMEVIQPRREARLAFSGVSRDFDLANHRSAIVDTGGGSTELIFVSSGVIDGIRPLPLGAVRLTEAFSDPNNPGRYLFGEMKRRIDRVLRKSIRRIPYRPDFIVGAGGTFTSLARVAIRSGAATGKAGRFPFAVRGCEVRRKTVLRILKSLRGMTLEERGKVAGLSSRRAEIIVAGLCIVERLMRFLRVDRLIVHDGGIRDGLVAEMIDELGFCCQHPRTHPGQVLGAAVRYAQRMKFPKDHSEHVSRLALKIFDALAQFQADAEGSWARPAHRDLLQCAAILHDVGRRMGHKNHHKHSYDMIVHADLATLTRREIEIIANTCRYHRKKGPRRKDLSFRKLGSDDQRIVAHLAGILRIADALDFSQRQNVDDVSVRATDDGIVFEVTALDHAEKELKRAARKADVFESAFHAKPAFVVSKSAKPMELVEAS